MFEVSVTKGASGRRSMLIRFQDIYPECFLKRSGTELPALTCWQKNNCHVGIYDHCMTKIVERVYRIFSNIDKLELIVLWWTQDWPTTTGSPYKRHMGLVVDKDENKQLRMAPLNAWAVKALKDNIGEKYSIDMGVLT